MKHEWTYRRLGDICRLYQPSTISAKEFIPDGKHKVYGSNGVIGSYDNYNHQESELIVACRGTCGKVNMTEPFSWINGNAMVVHPIVDDVSTRFLMYHLRGVNMQEAITGTSIPQITRQSLSPIIVGYPNLQEQMHIVAELDLLTDIIKKQGEQLTELENLAQSFFYDMFSDILNAEAKLTLKDVATYIIGLTYKPTDVSERGTIVLRSSNIQNNHLDFEDIVRVNVPIDNKKIVRDGDILMCARNGSARLVGKVARICDLEEEMSFGAFMTIIKSKFNDFLFYFFLSDYFRSQLAASQTATINQITSKMLDGIRLNVPSLEQQHSFAMKIADIETHRKALCRSIEESQKLFDYTMDKYFG